MKEPRWARVAVVLSILVGTLPAALAGAAAPAEPAGGVESLSGSYAYFNPSAGGDTSWIPGTPGTFCFTAESFTADWEYVYNLWVKWPADWTVTGVFAAGTPSCTGGGTFGTFSWSFETSPYEINISHPRYQANTEHCTASYCFDVIAGMGALNVDESWYWDGDGYGAPPHHPCSNDEYTPATMAGEPCDEAVAPPASIPPCCPFPELLLMPATQQSSGCNGSPQAHELTLYNGTFQPGTFDLAYTILDGMASITGPITVTAGMDEAVPFDVQLTPDLCAIPSSTLTAQVEATGNGYTATATIVKTIAAGLRWEAIPDSAPLWAGAGHPRDGCTARNAVGEWVTYEFGDTSAFSGFWGYDHATNTWYQPAPANLPADRWAPDWAYDPAANLCYVTGGANGPGAGTYNTAYRFDPVANAFTQLGSFSHSRAYHTSWVGVLSGVNVLCIGGGIDSGGLPMQSTQCYDLAQSPPGAWSAENGHMGPLPTDPAAAADGVLHAPGGDQFWYVGGVINAFATVSDEARYWDDADNAWHQAASTGVPRYRVEGEFFGGDFYQLGGTSGSPDPQPAAIRGTFDGSQWTWSLLPNLANYRADNVVAVTGDAVCSVDGEGGAGSGYVEKLVVCPICDQMGRLAGRVTDAETGDVQPACTAAELSLEPGGTIPVDPTSGAYGPLELVAGVYTLTAAAPGYGAETARVTIVDDVTTTQDFSLARPVAGITPPALSLVVLPGVSVTLPLTVANAGHAPLLFEIEEVPAGGRPLAAGLPLSGRQAPAAIGIDPFIAEELAQSPDGRARVFVAFDDTADLSAAAVIRDKTARVRAVRAELRRAGDRAQAGVRAWLGRRGIAYRVFAIDNTLLVEVDQATLDALAAFPGVSGLRGDHTYRVMPAEPMPPTAPDGELSWGLVNMGVPDVWAQGVTGEGAIVASVDTGAAYQHEALFRSYLCGNGPHADCWLDPNGGTTIPYDSQGHGTMMLSQMTGDNDPDLEYALGAAPGAGWIACLGCPNGACTDYTLNACADWLLMGTPYTPDVIDHAWGSAGTCGSPWYSAKLQAYRAAGILPIFAAGEDGPECNTDAWPANDPGAFAVGASTPEDLQAWFSGTGPGSCGKLQYPDVVAPGMGLHAADAGGGYVPDVSGTCLASALATGCAALVKSAVPDLTGVEIGNVLRDTAYNVPDTTCGTPQPDPNYRYGDGRVDCLSAVAAVHPLDIPWVTEEPAAALVPPQSGLPVSVTFQCTISDVGQILTGRLRIHHDDPCAGPVDVPLELTCTDEPVPDIDLSLSSIEPTLCPDTWAATPLDVCNLGSAPLNWTLDEEPPAAWLSASPISGTIAPYTCQAAEVTFDASSLSPGAYTSALHASSNDPDEPDIAVPVTLTVPVPAAGAAFDWSPPEPRAGETVLFSGTVAAGDPPLSFAWAFGDGLGGSGALAAHAYAAPGPYTVTLAVRNGCGETQADSIVVVRPLPPTDRYVYLPLVFKRD